MRKYKLLICDDEYFVIKGLRETIDWDELGIEIVADCGNGKLGLEAVHKYGPDLIISDIRMPIMDGLQLAEALARENFAGAIIIYSGYGDFEYARKALDYGVTSYLLKPVDNESLTAKIREVLGALEKERAQRNALEKYEKSLPILRRELLLGLLAGEGDAAAALRELDQLGISVPESGLVVHAELRGGNRRGGGAADIRKFADGLLTALSSFATVDLVGDKDFTVVTDMTDAGVLCKCINELFEDAVCADGVYSVAVSAPFQGADGIAAAYRQATELCADAIFPGINSLRSASDGGVTRRSRTVEDALRYIAENYGNKISVHSVAEYLYVSESHLMHEFKDGLGKTFNECVTEFRLLKAKELLAEGRLRVSEIAGRVGYADVRYFGQVFKDVTGMSPKEYADSCGKR